MPAASAASSFIPSPIRDVHPNTVPLTPTVTRPVYRKGKGPASTDAASSIAPSPIRLIHPNREPQTPITARPGPIDKKGKGPISIQDIVEGSYAVPDEPPSSKKKRKQQHDKFMATEGVQGDGPYGYYGGESFEVL